MAEMKCLSSKLFTLSSKALVISECFLKVEEYWKIHQKALASPALHTE